jgi:glycosyltransferase involved in cell wall biosynthesis
MRIDVVIPVHNGRRYLGETLRSVLAQTRAADRVIVVDDGSSDGSSEIIAAFAASTPVIRAIRQANRGPSAARNAGLAIAEAELVAFCDADDVWAPEKLERQLALFTRANDPQLGVVYCNHDRMDEDGKPIDAVANIEARHRGWIHDVLLTANLVAGSASGVMARLDALRACGGFDEALSAAEDWDLWLRLAKHWRFDFREEVLVHLRHHSGSAQRDAARMLAGDIKMLNKHAAEIACEPRAIAAARRNLSSRIKATWRTRSMGEALAQWDSLASPAIRAAVFADDRAIVRGLAGFWAERDTRLAERLWLAVRYLRYWVAVSQARRAMASRPVTSA